METVLNKPAFNMASNRLANAEGWGIFIDNGQCVVQRSDAKSPFLTDADAARFVMDMAAKGHSLHQIACDHIKAFNDKQNDKATIAQGLPETLPDLGYFIGTENYYAHSMGFRNHEGRQAMRYTDGVRHVADTAQAYWLLDVVFSHTVSIYANRRIPSEQKRLMVCKLERITKGRNTDGALFTIDDGNGVELARQSIEYTDFPAVKQTIWVQNGVAMLPTEY